MAFFSKPAEVTPDQLIYSVYYLDDKQVLAATRKGLFKGNRETGEWTPSSLPNRFPIIGKFVQASETDSSLVGWVAKKEPHQDQHRSGFYLSRDGGKKWKRIWSNLKFYNGFIYQDTIFVSVVERYGERESQFRIKFRKLNGFVWRDITHNMHEKMQVA